MFTRQRRNYRIFVYVALIAALCILVAALMWPKDSAPAAGEEVKAESEDEAGGQANKDENNENGQSRPDSKADENYGGNIKDRDDKAAAEDDKPVVSERKDAYYVVRRNGDIISVFFSDEKGQEIELETTGIVYELLTPEDQKRFDEGIKAESQEQLSSLLQDFES